MSVTPRSDFDWDCASETDAVNAKKKNIRESVVWVESDDFIKRQLQILFALLDVKSGRLEFFVFVAFAFRQIPIVVKVHPDVDAVSTGVVFKWWIGVSVFRRRERG